MINSVGTEVALGRGVGVFIDINRVIGARLHAHFATDTTLVVKVNDSVGANKQSLGRATLQARSVGAMVATHDAHLTGGGGVLPFVHVFHPGAELSDRYVVLGLASDRAGVTPDAGSLVNGESVSHVGYFFLM